MGRSLTRLVDVNTMHLLDILALRQVPAAGIYLSLTRRCPLSCAHCSTNSTLTSEEYPGEPFLRLVESFTPSNRPELIVLTGGEPLIRPRLVRELINRAHAAGVKVVLASGMFFASEPEVPRLIADVIADVDHFTCSLDIFHEQQVPRASVFRVIRDLVDHGKQVSFMVIGLNDDDPYLSDITRAIRHAFDDRVPMLVGTVGAVGRAKAWLNPARARVDVGPMPCDLAAWPVVTYDGTMVACCNQGVVDGPIPPHLRLGSCATDDWAVMRERYLTAPMPRAIRVFGPEYIADQYSDGSIPCDGYCSTCYRLSADPRVAERLAEKMARPAMRFVEDQVLSMQREHFVPRHNARAYTELVKLGYELSDVSYQPSASSCLLKADG